MSRKNSEGSAVAAGMVLVAIVAIIALGFGLMLLFPQDGLTGQEILKRFSSCQEMESFLQENSGQYGMMGAFGAPAAGMVSPEVSPMAGDMTGAAPTRGMGAGEHSEDYSTTNIQVEGVDEPDIVKSDGKYLYIVAGGRITIVDAYPAEGAVIVSELNVTGNPSEIFINGDRLAVFTQGSWSGKYASSVLVYDVADRGDPALVRNVTLEGYYHDSRMIGDYVYVISRKPVQSWSEPGIPRILSATAETPVCGCADVYYFDVPDSSYQFTTITSLNLNDVAEPQSKVFLMGYNQNLFVSRDNIYISYQKNVNMMDMYDRVINEALIPNLPPQIASQVAAVWNSDADEYEKTQGISSILMNYTESLGPEQAAEFMKNLQDKIQGLMVKIAKEVDQSVVHRVSISGGNIEYAAGGSFPGRVLNQFSMDEYNGFFRVATTAGGWIGGARLETVNNVYVLDSAMNIVGRLEDLASGESIYSARFMGDRAYMVTFERIDPLFVIDLSNPSSPKVLGELKIPGYSDYLHPYDEDHIIGIGMETEENQWGGISTSGIKLSLFDVSDVANPREISKYVIGGRGSYSLALQEHKAFLFNRVKELLVIPARVREGEGKDYWSRYWHGAYVFQVNLEDGIKYRGRIAHQSGANETESWYDYQYDVKRSLYMDDVLYTLSDRMLVMNSLVNLQDVNSLELPYQEYPVYKGPLLEGGMI